MKKSLIVKRRSELGVVSRRVSAYSGTPGERLSYLTEIHGLSMQTISEATEIPLEVLFAIVSNEKKADRFNETLMPDYETLCRLALLFDVPMLWLGTGHCPRSWEDMPELKVGQRINMLLRYYDMNYRELGSAVAIRISAISAWVRRSTVPREDVTNRLSEFFGIDLTWLKTGYNPAGDYRNQELLSAIFESVDQECERYGISFDGLSAEQRSRVIDILYRFFQREESPSEKLRRNPSVVATLFETIKAAASNVDAAPKKSRLREGSAIV